MPARLRTGQAITRADGSKLSGFLLGTDFGPAGALCGGDAATGIERHHALLLGTGSRGTFLLSANLGPAGTLRGGDAATGTDGKNPAAGLAGAIGACGYALTAQSAES